MTELPPFVYALTFWQGLSYLVAGVLAILAYFKKIEQKWALTAGVVLAAILAVLNFLGVVPELMIRGLI